MKSQITFDFKEFNALFLSLCVKLNVLLSRRHLSVNSVDTNFSVVKTYNPIVHYFFGTIFFCF